MQKTWNTAPSLLALSILAATSPVIAQEAQNIDTDEAEEAVEVIEVKGLKASLIRSSELKRAADNFKDVITAEDVGKFPDNDALESMARISGIQIDRDFSGTASGFTVRGMTQNRIELNGRSVAAGEGNGRNANLADIPSDLIAGLEVIKSPTADMIEGSLGATINLKTARPLQRRDNLNRITLRGRRGDNVGENYGNIGAVVSRKWRSSDFGRFGAMINITHNDNIEGGDVLRTRGWGLQCDMYTQAGNGNINRAANRCDDNDDDPTNDNYFAPNGFTALQYEQDRTNTQATVTLQWRPDDSSEYILDMSYLKSDRRERRDTLNLNLLQGNGFLSAEQFQSGAVDGVYRAFSNVATEDYTATLYDVFGNPFISGAPVNYLQSNAAFINNTNGQGEHRENERITLGLIGRWSFDTLDVEAEFAYSEADFQRNYTATQLQRWAGNPRNQANHILRVDEGEAIRVGGSTVIADLTDAQFVDLDWRGHDLLDPRYFRLGNAQDDGWTQTPSEMSLRMDFDYALDWKDIATLEFGFRVTDNVQERDSRFRFRCARNYAWGGNGPNGQSYDADTDLACESPFVSTVDMLAAHPEAFQITDGFFDQEGSVNINSWFQPAPSLFLDDRNSWREIWGFNESGGFNFAENETYKITEKTGALYLKANFAGELGSDWEYRGNIGTRWVYTDVESEYTPGGVSATEVYDYDNLLPSVNVALIKDNFLMRFAAASVMVRPDYNELSPVGSFNQFIGCGVYNPDDPYNIQRLGNNPDLWSPDNPLQYAQAQYLDTGAYDGGLFACPGIRGFGTTIGNTQLDPYTANNYDLSFEYYWGEGNSASITFFYRDIKADIVRRRAIIDIPVDPATQVIGGDGGEDSILDGQPISLNEGFERWRVRQVVNGGVSTREGIELAYTQFFDFLPEPFDGVGFTANYTFADGERPDPVFIDTNEDVIDFGAYGLSPGSFSEMAVAAQGLVDSGDIEGFDLLDQYALLPIDDMSRHTVNFSLFYDKNDLSLRLSYNYRDSFYRRNSGVGRDAVYEDDFDRVDFASSYNISEDLDVVFNVQNLIRTKRQRYWSDPALTERSYYADRIFTLGVGYRF